MKSHFYRLFTRDYTFDEVHCCTHKYLLWCIKSVSISKGRRAASKTLLVFLKHLQRWHFPEFSVKLSPDSEQCQRLIIKKCFYFPIKSMGMKWSLIIPQLHSATKNGICEIKKLKFHVKINFFEHKNLQQFGMKWLSLKFIFITFT